MATSRRCLVLLTSCCVFGNPVIMQQTGNGWRPPMSSSGVAQAVEGSPIARTSKLRKHDREQLVKARIDGKAEVTLCIATLPGASESLVREATALGAKVLYRDETVNYLRLEVPIDRVESISRLREVQTVNLSGDSTIYPTGIQDRTEVPGTGATQENIPPPGRDTPAMNPYLPTRDIGAPQFMAKHPTFDGRGVTICVFEGYPADMLGPELQTATTLDGKPTRKMSSVIDATDPATDVPRSFTRVKMQDQVTSSGGHFTYKGVSYTSPADGTHRISIYYAWPFEEVPFPKKHFNRPGISADERSKYAVLWDNQSNTVWVDTNQNHDFTDDKPMTDYNVRPDIGLFGKDDPKTPERESVGFILLANPQRDFVNILPLFSGHPTQTTAVAAGIGFFGGKMNGAAPRAQLVSVLYGDGMAGQIEGMIQAIRDPTIDLITMQHVLHMRLNDGNSTASVIFDRLIEKYNKPIFISASNSGPGINTGAENAAGSNVISVGAYVHKDTWRSNYGLSVDKEDYVANFSSRGPRKDGGFKPDVVAPGIVITADNYSGLDPNTTPTGVRYKLSPGHTVAYGTSFSSPIAAGGAALLISAAKQAGVPYDAERLKWAIKVSAKRLPGWAAHEQGDGLMQVEAAWEALKRAPDTVRIRSVATVNAGLSDYLKEPNKGPGIYEREGWKAGQTAQRSITLIRETGPQRTINYKLRWVGDVDTFSSPETIGLPLDRPVSLPVRVSPRTAGVHSAILYLDSPEGSLAIFEVMNTVVAAEQFSQDNQFEIRHEGQAEYPGYSSYFLSVPPNTNGLYVEVKASSDTSRLKLRLLTPSSDEYRNPTPNSNAPRFQPNPSQFVANPEPGVWEAVVDNGNDGRWVEQPKEAQARAAFTFTSRLFGIEADSAIGIIRPESAANGLPLRFENRLATFVGGLTESALGSAFFAHPVLKDGGIPQIYEVDVPPGAETLRAYLNGDSDTKTDLDLYVYFCREQTPESTAIRRSESSCDLKGYSVNGGSREAVTLNKPAAGRWKIAIDPLAVSSGTTTIEYLDVFAHTAFGKLRATDSLKPRASGSTWTETANLEITAIPQRGRRLVWLLEVATEKGKL
jgi:hypothetical protein